MTLTFNDPTAPTRVGAKLPSVGRLATVFCLALLFVLVGRASLAASNLTQVHSKWAWSTYGEEVGANGFVVEDLDGDGRSEILASTSLSGLDWWYQVNLTDRLLQTWSSFPVEGEEMELRGIELAQTPEAPLAVVMTENAIEVFDAISKRHLHDFQTLSTDNRAIAVADLTGDGSLEAIVCDSQDLTVYDLATGTASSTKEGFGCSDVAIGQVDSDPQLEIALARSPFASYILDGLTLEANGGDISGLDSSIALGDLVGDSRDELVVSNCSTLRALDPTTGSLLWQQTIPSSFFGCTFSLAEVNPSPGVEVLLADGFNIRILAGDSGLPLWTLPFQGTVSAIGAGDVDGDSVADIAWSLYVRGVHQGAIFVSPGSAPAEIFETDPFAGGPVGLGVGGAANAADVEVMTAISRGGVNLSGVLVALSFSQGRQLRRSSPEQTEVLSELHGIRAAQLDEDAQLEICGWSYYQPGTACFDSLSFEEEWSAHFLAGISTMSVGELDRADFPELIATTHGENGARITVQESESGLLKWQSPPISLDSIVSVAVMDRFPSGDVEIAAALSPFGGACTSLARIDAEIGVPIGPPLELDFSAMETKPLDPGVQLFLALLNGDVAEINLENGELGLPIANFPGFVKAIEMLDLTRDGVEDVVAAVSSGHLYVFDGALQAVTWESPFLGYLGSDPANSLLAGDFDGDTVPDLLIETRVGIFAFEGPLVALFGDGFESGGTTGWSATIP
ncbi:MAG TPA: hypothetical protein PK593_07415 [Thermomicrobiales bacterium]|nr:hypothetical protein [Thermoanaerobaculia bacterium]HQX63274.1 hypothetical protein [Thermomicrobiales bacterium]